VDVLGYTESSAGKAWTATKNHPVGKGNVDVALGHFSADDSRILAPFELKGAKTRDLDVKMAGRNKSPVEQAWEYAMDAKGAKWVLVSNYREIRLYAVGYGRKDYESFDLSRLTDPAAYARFMLLLSANHLMGDRTLALLKESEQKEKDITKELYNDYKALRSQLINTLTRENPATPALDIINHSQTILDRILFVAFAEDKGLLPKETLKKAYETQNHFNPQPVWENFKGLFLAIDKGSPPLNITGYNGGLFAKNAEINALSLSDALCEGFKKIGDYDFESDVSVNILGHIFEQSITDLEEIKAATLGEAETFDKKKSKRKKDGIFYTPPYITRYIVEQAVGGWLNDRKAELGFDKLPELTEADYASIKTVKGTVRYNAKIEKHIKAWEAYKAALSNIKVLDPACGSGAFLNEVFDFLYREGKAINSELTTLNGGQAQLFRWDTHILANNLYGVDINRESVEITKLSLWLKTANKGEKLTYLDNNIKCGNSLIDDPAVAGDLAFNWQQEFAEIMQSGGFDVVVGNPPYGATLSEADISWLAKRYKSFEYQINTYVLFYDHGLGLLRQGGILGYITPATFTYQHYFQNIRKMMQPLEVRSICKYGFAVFEDADIGDTVSFVIQKLPRKNKATQILVCQNKEETSITHTLVNYEYLIKKDGTYNLSSDEVLDKAYKKSKLLGECADIVVSIKAYEIGKGVPSQTPEITASKPFNHNHKATASCLPCLVGSNFHRYTLTPHPIMWIEYGEWLAAPRPSCPFFESEKIVIRQTADRIIAHLDDTQSVNLNNVYNIGRPRNGLEIKYILAILNSTLMKVVYRAVSQEKGKLFAEVKKVYLEKLPIKPLNKEQQRPFIEKAEIMLAKNKELHELSSKFLALLKSEFALEKPSTKLEQWYILDFAAFMAELAKKKITPSLAKKAEWMAYFEQQKAAALTLKTLIDTTDHEIDQMVYALYNLTPEEITIVEGSA
jgi:type I restriction-modification system DNA methylase subunit